VTRLTGSWVQVDWLRAACGGLEDSCTDHALIVIHTNALKTLLKIIKIN